jgi:hypothetical protein
MEVAMRSNATVPSATATAAGATHRHWTTKERTGRPARSIAPIITSPV